MGTNRKRLVAAAASMVVAVGLAGCGGDSGDSSDGPKDQSGQEVTEATQGGTVYSLEQSVTEHLDPQRTYVGRDIANLGRLAYRSWVMFPVGETDVDKASTPIPALATDPGQSNEAATQWSFTLKDGPKWQDGKPITWEGFKYGVARTFPAAGITRGPEQHM